MGKWRDNFFTGIISVCALTTTLYFLLIEIVRPFAEENSWGQWFFYPKPELLILVVDIVLFRIFMINLDLHKFAKGWLLGVFVFMLWFFYNFYHQ